MVKNKKQNTFALRSFNYITDFRFVSHQDKLCKIILKSCNPMKYQHALFYYLFPVI